MLKNYINQNIIDAVNNLKIGVYHLEVLSPFENKLKGTTIIFFGFDNNSVLEEFKKSFPNKNVIKIEKMDTFVFKDKENRIFPVSEDYENFENNYLIYQGLCWDKTKEVSLKVRNIFINEFSQKSA